MESMNAKVLYITYDGITDPLGQSQVLPYLQRLSAEGFQITIVSFEKQEPYQRIGDKIHAVLKQHNIKWIHLPYANSIPVISPVLNLVKLMRTVKKLATKETFSIVHCRGTYLTSFPGLWMKKKFGTKYLFDIRGFWADERVDAGLWSLSNPLFKLIYTYFKKKEREFIIGCDAAVLLTENGKKEILSWPFVDRHERFSVIPCCVDMQLFSDKQVNETLLSLVRQQLNSSVVISYVGSIGSWYMLNEMLDFFRVVQKKFADARFMFITPGSKQEITQAAAAKGIDASSLYITFSERENLPTYLAASTYSVFFIRPTYSKKASSPTKHGEIMSMGIPLICNSGVGDMDTIVKETQSGVVLSEFTDEAYEKAVAEIQNTRFNKDHIRNACADIYSVEKGSNVYLHIYNRLLRTK